MGMLGIAATLILHSLFLVVAIWGDSYPLRPRLPERIGAGANVGSAEGSSLERLIMVELQPQVQPPLPAEQPVLLEKIRAPSMVAVTGPDALPAPPLFPSEEGDSERASDADLVARTQLVGLYEQQIRARIERAWQRPREPIRRQADNTTQDEDRFRCRVLIRQDARGGIRELELQRCNGSERWQRSLTDAIFASSPLPAPPNPQVFADAFSMQFEAVSYSDAQPGGLYESEHVLVVSTSSDSSASTSSSTLNREAVDQSSGPKVRYLNVTADKIEWSTAPPPRADTSHLLVPESKQNVQ